MKIVCYSEKVDHCPRLHMKLQVTEILLLGELPENDTEDNSLDKLLNSLWTPEGTFMHRAAQVSIYIHCKCI